MKKATNNTTIFDTAWLMALAAKKLAHKPEIALALQQCILCRWESDGYVHFIYPACSAEKPQHAGGTMISDKKYGTLVIDMLSNGRIAGIEFLDVVLGYDCSNLLNDIKKTNF